MATLMRKYIILVPRKDLADCILLEVAGLADTLGQAKEEIEKTPPFKKMVPFLIVEADLLQSPVIIQDSSSTIVNIDGQPIVATNAKEEPCQTDPADKA